MEKETVEANDLKFRQKVEELRTQLESRRQTYTRKRKAGLYFTFMVLSFLVMVTAAGYYLREQTALREPSLSPGVSEKSVGASAPSHAPSSMQPCTPQPRAPARTTAAIVRRTATLMSPVPTVLEEPRSVEPPVPAAEVWQVSPAVEPSVAVPVTAPLPSVASTGRRKSVSGLSIARPTISTQSTDAPFAVRSTRPVPRSIPTPPVPSATPLANPDSTVVARAEPAPPTPAPPGADFRITASQACLDVVARECVGAQAVFVLHEHNIPHVWMTVHSQNLPYVLKHVYYHEGERYAEVPLAVTYPRMRTWSNVTLRSPTHVGDWRVEIVTKNGAVVKQVEFRVTP